MPSSSCYPVTKTYEELRDGRLDFVGGAAHAALYAFKDWQGGRLLCALAQHMYWFLVVRSDLKAQTRPFRCARPAHRRRAGPSRRQEAALLQRAGIDPQKDVQIGPVPEIIEKTASFGLMAAKALADGKLDGFWANGMGAEVAVRNEIGTVLLDARRDGSGGSEGLYLSRARCGGEDDPRTSRSGAQRGQRRHGGTGCAQEEPGARNRGRPQALSADGSEPHRRAHPARRAVLRPEHLAPQHRSDEPLRTRHGELLSRDVAYEDVVWKG